MRGDILLRECSSTASLSSRWACICSCVGSSGCTSFGWKRPVANNAASLRRASALFWLYSNVIVHIPNTDLMLDIRLQSYNFFVKSVLFQALKVRKRGWKQIFCHLRPPIPFIIYYYCPPNYKFLSRLCILRKIWLTLHKNIRDSVAIFRRKERMRVSTGTNRRLQLLTIAAAGFKG